MLEMGVGAGCEPELECEGESGIAECGQRCAGDAVPDVVFERVIWGRFCGGGSRTLSLRAHMGAQGRIGGKTERRTYR